MTRRLILIGGSAGTGKTTTARAIAAEIGAGWLQLDSVWIALLDGASGESERDLLDIRARVRDGHESAEDLVGHVSAAAAAVCRVLPSVLAFELDAHETLVADGAWVLPEFVAGLDLPDTAVSAVYLHEPDLGALERFMGSRREGAAPKPWHEKGARLAWLYGNWLVDQAKQLGQIVVPAQPFANLPDRVKQVLAH